MYVNSYNMYIYIYIYIYITVRAKTYFRMISLFQAILGKSVLLYKFGIDNYK